MNRLLVLVLLIVAPPIMAAPARSQCMQAEQPGEIAEGRLTRGNFKDAAGRPERAYILTLPVPTCLRGDEDTDNVKQARTIQIYSSKDAIDRSIGRFVGKTVLVRGSAFGAVTVHHHAPIVMDISEIDSH